MAVKTFSVSMDERAYRHAKNQADQAGLTMSAWITRAAREKVQRDAAVQVAEIDRQAGNDWAAWTETNESDQEGPNAGKGGA